MYTFPLDDIRMYSESLGFKTIQNYLFMIITQDYAWHFMLYCLCLISPYVHDKDQNIPHSRFFMPGANFHFVREAKQFCKN